MRSVAQGHCIRRYGQPGDFGAPGAASANTPLGANVMKAASAPMTATAATKGTDHINFLVFLLI